MSRRAARVDANHNEIVKALRAAGASVQSLADAGDGVPDLLVGFRGRNWILELKDGKKPPSHRRLTAPQIDWHAAWRGDVRTVLSPDEALHVIGVIS